MDIVYFVFKCCQSAHPKSALSWRSSWLQAALPPRGTPKDSPSAHGCAPRNLENFLRPKVELQSSRARAKYRGLNCLGFHHHDISWNHEIYWNIIRCHKSKIQNGSKDLHPLHWHLALSRILNLVSTRRAPQPLRFILAILWLQVAQGLSGIQPGAIVWLEANENLSQGPKEEKNHLANNATAIGPHANANSTFRKGPLRAPLWEAGHLDVVTLPARRTSLTAGLLWRYEIFGESFVASFSGAWSRHKAPSSALNLVQMCEMATKSWDICIKKNWNLGWIRHLHSGTHAES